MSTRPITPARCPHVPLHQRGVHTSHYTSEVSTRPITPARCPHITLHQRGVHTSHYTDNVKYEAIQAHSINNTMTNCFYCPGLGQTQKCDGVKLVDVIPSLPISLASTVQQLHLCVYDSFIWYRTDTKVWRG